MLNKTLPDNTIILGTSMIKNTTNIAKPDLGVIRCATFTQGFLNRQIIVLLSCLGTSD